MSDIICLARKCQWNDNDINGCTLPTIRMEPNPDDAEPPTCSYYSDPWYEEGVDNEHDK